ncbi:MAG: DUF1631 family protein [Thiobacillus sp.]|nr:DUF1631 family protein [Thiobacillus sp.]
MPTLPDHPSAVALIHEADIRMAQALDNFFQRSRIDIQDTILRAIAAQISSSMLATGQICLDWLNANPDALSRAFAEQFRQHLAHPETFEQKTSGQSAHLQLVDDAVLGRQLAAEKIAAHLKDTLYPELLLLFGRLQSLMQHTQRDHDQAKVYGPMSVIHALSRALDALGLPLQSGTLLMQSTVSPLCDTLKHTYTALNQFLSAHGVEAHTTGHSLPASTHRRTEAVIGRGVLAHIQSVAAHNQATLHPTARTSDNLSALFENGAVPAALPRFLDSLAYWQTHSPQASGTLPESSAQPLQLLQRNARHTDAGSFDLAVLDALADLFEFILGDPGISPRYKSAIAQLQIPTLRVALESPEFFNDDHHPARQLIDLLGQYSRRFPDDHPAHADALQQIEAVCAHILSVPHHPTAGFAQAYRTLDDWLHAENTRAETELTTEVVRLQQIESQELGTLLALQNLHDLTARHPAPEAVLRRLEDGWIPYMASLYVAESGEGANWRDACATLLQLFMSLQAPEPDAREARLQAIPAINSSLRRGLLAQGADPAQLKNFFSAITATQECWIRPDVSRPISVVNTFVPRRISPDEVESLARHLADPTPNDFILQQTQQLLEGDWVDFDPPREGLASARVAWVGSHGYLLFCDNAGAQQFSLDCTQLAAEVHAGRAHIPEQSLTRKAMLRLETQLRDDAI